MADQSHREEMNAAIRAQRERHAVPRTIAPEPAADVAERDDAIPAAPEPSKSLLDRLRGR